MKRNARLAPAAKVALIALAVTGAAGLTGCTVEGQNSPPTSSAAPGSTTTSTASATGSTTGQAAGECPTGTYDVATITGKQSVDIQGQRVTFGGTVSGLTFTMDAATWKLTGDNAKAKINVAGVTELDATIDGMASGNYTKSGSQYQFVLNDSSGTATVALAGVGSQQIDMSVIADAIAPRGRATINCTASGATIESDSVSLELKRAGTTTSTS
jgi:hypothetical protein